MRKICTYGMLILFLFSFCFLLTDHTAFASEIVSVTDEAGLLTESELLELETLCRETGALYNIDIIVHTVQSIPDTRKQFIEDYYDANDTVLTDAAILLLNMDPNDRGVEIQGYGQCEFNLSDDRIESMLDAILPYFSDGNYLGGLQEFVSQTDYYMNVTPTVTMSHAEMEASENAIPHLRNFGIALVIGAVAVVIMVFTSGSRITTNQGTYLDRNDSRILGRYDRYIRTTTTKRPKPKETSSGGSGGGGVSSGGNSHSGGGRSF